MTKQYIINYKLATALAALVLSFGLALPASAESPYSPLDVDYKNLEIKIEIGDAVAEVEVSYEDQDGKEVEREYEFGTTDLDEIYEKLAAKLSLSEETVEDAVSEIEYDEDTSDDDDDKDRGHGNDKDRCDSDNPGKKRCDDITKKEWKRENYSERFKDFGKSTDEDELRGQLRELLLVLIELLQAQSLLGR